VRQLVPDLVEPFDPAALTDAADRPAPAGRPWVMANMVMSADGAYSVSGRSGALASPADKLLFHTLRASADMILVAAETARVERYRRPTTRAELVEGRLARGQERVPRLAVVTRSARFPPDQPFLTGEGPDPVILHPAGATDPDPLPGVELRATGAGADVDLVEALARLRSDGVQHVLCEGGPRLLGQLHQQGLLDELFVTLSPVLVGGTATGLLGPVAEATAAVRLHRVLEEDGSLFLTYRTGAG